MVSSRNPDSLRRCHLMNNYKQTEMKAMIKFRMQDASDWYVTKVFADKQHVDNYINLVCRTKGCFLDEVWYDIK